MATRGNDQQQQAALPPEPAPRRSPIVIIWVLLLVAWSIFSVVSYLSGGNSLAYVSPEAPRWPIVLVIAATVMQITFGIALILGDRFGFWGFVGAFILMTVGALLLGFNLINIIIAVVGLGVLAAFVLPNWRDMR